ncbi:serine hydrolase domain-containing protein [Devosia nitrariae]|uniref:Serine hydrolase n=1 Tax=Devosia nitrariae TaxID=2071872 RepID=A0ABQ5WD94_9HYPH|nr:serine hydrolase domain-containing protein [Devosia nitrariae]GLQ57900.1 serine hydrolase [Devosia nitrariae]
MQNAIDRVIDNALAARRIVGTVVLVARDGETVYRRAAGLADREAGKVMEENTIFRLASVTKPIVAATALALIDQGGLGLDDAVETHLPYFTPRLADGRRPAITIRQLLTHTAGLAYAYSDPMISTGLGSTDFDFEANFTRVAALPLSFEPGTAWQYSIAIDVLGAVIAAVERVTLDEAARRYVTGPLGMADTGFLVTDPARLAVPYGDAEPEPVRMGDPHVVVGTNGESTLFSPGRIFNPRAFHSGGAGMVGSAGDILAFLEALRREGDPILSAGATTMAMRNQIGALPRDAPGMRFGYLGAVLDDPAAAGWPSAPGTVNWGGVYGHSWLIDPANGLSVAIMTNTALEGCTGQFPADVRNAVYGVAPEAVGG